MKAGRREEVNQEMNGNELNLHLRFPGTVSVPKSAPSFSDLLETVLPGDAFIKSASEIWSTKMRHNNMLTTEDRNKRDHH